MKRVDRQQIEIKIKGDLDPFIARLSELNCDCRLGERDVLQVSTPDGMSTRAIFEVADLQGVQIRHFYYKKDSLEDVFIKVLENETPPEATPGEIAPHARL